MSNLSLRNVTWLAVLACVAAAPVFAGTLIPGSVNPTPTLPPANGAYVTAAEVHACFGAGGSIGCLSQGNHGFFTGNVLTQNGTDQFETFGSTFNGLFTPFGQVVGIPIHMQGPVQVVIHNRTVPTQLGTFNTEMLALDLSGGGVMIRESPTLPSLGQTRLTDIGGGSFRIDSFFDIFTELSLDGGQTWNPSVGGATSVNLLDLPEPGTWFLLSTSLAGLAAFRMRRRG